MKKMQNRQTREFFICEIVRGVIKDVVRIDIPVGNITVKETTVHFSNISQAARSELFIKKQQILKLINDRQAAVKIIEIK